MALFFLCKQSEKMIHIEFQTLYLGKEGKNALLVNILKVKKHHK